MWLPFLCQFKESSTCKTFCGRWVKFTQVSVPTAWIFPITAFINIHSEDSHAIVTKYFAKIANLLLKNFISSTTYLGTEYLHFPGNASYKPNRQSNLMNINIFVKNVSMAHGSNTVPFPVTPPPPPHTHTHTHTHKLLPRWNPAFDVLGRRKK